MKQVTVYSTQGQNKQVVNTSAGTWGELQSILGAHGVSYSGMKVVVGESQVTLESNAAVLPEGDFTLFLLPQKVKSGVFGFSSFDDDDCGCEDDDEDEVEDNSTIGQIRSRIASIYEALGELEELVEDQATVAPVDPKNAELKSKADQIAKDLGIFG